MPKLNQKHPIVNAHAHVFTHKHVPPYLAKTLVVWPFYYLINVPFFVWVYKLIVSVKSRKYHTRYKRFVRWNLKIKRLIQQYWISRLVLRIILIWCGITCFFILFNALDIYLNDGQDEGYLLIYIKSFRSFLQDVNLLFVRPEWFPVLFNFIFCAAVLLWVKSVRNAVLFLLNQIWKFLHLLPGKKTKALLSRYLKMARFATYGSQPKIFSRLRRQYPVGSHFILLSMDMAYMGAGPISRKGKFYEQLAELAILNKKTEVHPFIFIDPRRISDKKLGKDFFDFSHQDGKIMLKDSIVKKYIEEEAFSGFKIYPALGYFPFDEALLPLWKYAADNNIPIMTHGVKGVIYYRGRLKKEWNEHPVFNEFIGKDGFKPILFKQFNNAQFQANFTHPLNFLCLLEEPLLRILVGKSKSSDIKKIFGYIDKETPLKHNLSKLKVCYAHYGGSEEWEKFLDRDRDNYAQQLMAKPAQGINLGIEEGQRIPWARYENIWKYTDWYSIVSSMMIQYENFYADISYIVSNPKLYPMLRSTISESSSVENLFTKELTYGSKEKLRKKVLFGSDFYVVRSQKSDKDIFIELKSSLSDDEFDLVARENPARYLAIK